jgi:hypothetical protein
MVGQPSPDKPVATLPMLAKRMQQKRMRSLLRISCRAVLSKLRECDKKILLGRDSTEALSSFRFCVSDYFSPPMPPAFANATA